MCVSILAETDPTRLANALGVTHILGAAADGTARVEARGAATVIRMGAGGRLVAERMAFNPYILRRANVGGDLWGHALLGEAHGILVVRAFSEWVSAERIVQSGLVNVFEANCAFNRFAMTKSSAGEAASGRDRLVLANFRPHSGSALLVPVLFDTSRRKDAKLTREFSLITHEPAQDLAMTGVAHEPVSLIREAALAWLTAPDSSATPDLSSFGDMDIDLDRVLEDEQDEDYQFSLFKSA